MPQPWKAQRHKRGHWLQEQIGNNDQWLQRKSVAMCKCTDANGEHCINQETADIDTDTLYVKCGCRCHKGV